MAILPFKWALASLYVLLTTVIVSGAPNGPISVDFLYDPIRVLYCPFNMTGVLSEDFSAIDIIYDFSKPQSSQSLDTCFSRFYFDFTPWDNEFFIESIDYIGAKHSELSVNTKTVFWPHYGPLSWTSVSLSSESRTSYNTSRNQGSQYGRCDLSIRTTFTTHENKELKAFEGQLTQRLKLSWMGKYISPFNGFPQCEWPDSKGNLGSCNPEWKAMEVKYEGHKNE